MFPCDRFALQKPKDRNSLKHALSLLNNRVLNTSYESYYTEKVSLCTSLSCKEFCAPTHSVTHRHWLVILADGDNGDDGNLLPKHKLKTQKRRAPYYISGFKFLMAQPYLVDHLFETTK